MSVAKVIELSTSSTTGIEDAVKSGLAKCAESVKDIQGAWVKRDQGHHRRGRQHPGVAGESENQLRGEVSARRG